MKGIINIWLPATLGLLVGFSVSLPAEAREVTVTVGDAQTITGIGDLNGDQLGYDQVGFTGSSNKYLLTATQVPDPNYELTINLGTFKLTQAQNCGTFDGVDQCSGVVGGTLNFSLDDGGAPQNANLQFTWSTEWGYNESVAVRFNTSVQFAPADPPAGSPLSPSYIFRSGFDTLIITLLKPVDITNEQTFDGVETTRDIFAKIALIPEPGSIPLFGLGLLALAVVGRGKHFQGLNPG